MSDIGDELREYYFSAPADAGALTTIELRHPSFTEPVRLVNDMADLVATLEDDAPANAGETVTFMACQFEATKPESAEQGLPSFSLAIQNVTRQLDPYQDQALAVAAPIDMSIREYMVDDTSAPQQVIHGLNAKTSTSGILRVTVQAGFEDLLNKSFPFKLYRTSEYPTLVR